MSSIRTKILFNSLNKPENGSVTCKFCNKIYPPKSQEKNSHWEKHVVSKNCHPMEDFIQERNELIEKLKELENESQFAIPNDLRELAIDDIFQSSPSKKLETDCNDEFLTKFSYFLFSSGLPLSIIENDKLLQALKVLSPNLKLPSRKTLSNRILKENYDSMNIQLFQKINQLHSDSYGIKGTLMVDSWTNCRHDSVVSFIYSSPCLPRPIFIDCIFPGTISVDASFVAFQTKKIIQKIGSKRVSCVTTDGAKSMENARILIQQDFPTLWIPSCINHLISNMIKILEKRSAQLSSTIKMASDVAFHFKMHHVPNALFKSLAKGLMIQTPNQTRWFSNLSMFESLSTHMATIIKCCHDKKFHNRNSMVDGVLKQVPLSGPQTIEAKRIQSIVDNGEVFWKALFFFIDLLAPLRELSKKYESLYPPIQDIYPDLKEYEDKIENLNVDYAHQETVILFREILKEKLNVFNADKKFAMAHYLDPLKRGSSLGESILEIVSDMSTFFPESKKKYISE